MPLEQNNKVTLVQFGQNANDAVSARYLSGILRAYGYKVTIVCLGMVKQQGSGQAWDYGYYDISDNAIKELFAISAGSLFIGFTVYSFVAHILKQIYISEHNREKIPLVVGGPHPTLDPYNASLFSDYVCVGDAEGSIVQLAQSLSSTKPPAAPDSGQAVSGNIFASYGLRQAKTQEILCGREDQLNLQSFPDYSFESEYYISGQGCEKITPENASRYIDTYATFFSRGCVNNCSFCGHEMIALRSGFQKRIKNKGTAHFIDELKLIRPSYPWVNRVVFFDPNILSNTRESLKIILDAYRSSVGLPLSVTGFTFNQTNAAIYTEFISAGMDSVIFGIESAADKTRKLYNRRESKQQILEVDALNYRLKQKNRIFVQYDLIVDSPWEDADDTLASVAFVAQLKGYDYLDIFSLRFFPGTKLFQKAIADGILKTEEIDSENRRVYRSMQFTYENFLLLLVRDNFLRNRLLVRIAVSPKLSRIMRKIFKKSGKHIFGIYASKFPTGLIKIRNKAGKLFSLFRILGAAETFKIIKSKLGKKV